MSVDRWGTTISFPEDAPGAMPLNHGELAVCRDITRWRETVHDIGKNLVKIMEGMLRVVSLAEEKGIRDKVRIFVGGAPISQSFCDEIGADVYTEDAGAAARAAVEILRSCQSSR